MRISRVVAELSNIAEERGDLEVVAFDYGDIAYFGVGAPEVETDGEGALVVLLRP